MIVSFEDKKLFVKEDGSAVAVEDVRSDFNTISLEIQEVDAKISGLTQEVASKKEEIAELQAKRAKLDKDLALAKKILDEADGHVQSVPVVDEVHVNASDVESVEAVDEIPEGAEVHEGVVLEGSDEDTLKVVEMAEESATPEVKEDNHNVIRKRKVIC